MPKKKSQFDSKFIRNACALEEQIEPLNVPAAFGAIRSQMKVDTGWFYLWLFQKLSGYPEYAAVDTGTYPGTRITLSASFMWDTSYLHVYEDTGLIKLVLADEEVKLPGASTLFMDVFRDACRLFKAHIEKLYTEQYKQLIELNKALRVPFPCIQVQVAQPDPAWTGVNKKPVLLLFRDPDSGAFVKLTLTKAQAAKLEALSCLEMDAV